MFEDSQCAKSIAKMFKERYLKREYQNSRANCLKLEKAFVVIREQLKYFTITNIFMWNWKMQLRRDQLILWYNYLYILLCYMNIWILK